MNNENLADLFFSPNELKQAMDSSIYEEYHQFDDGWRNDTKEEHDWNESGKETMNIQSYWHVEENRWITFQKSEYSYNAGGRLLLISTQRLQDATEWIDMEKTEFTSFPIYCLK